MGLAILAKICPGFSGLIGLSSIVQRAADRRLKSTTDQYACTRGRISLTLLEAP